MQWKPRLENLENLLRNYKIFLETLEFTQKIPRSILSGDQLLGPSCCHIKFALSTIRAFWELFERILDKFMIELLKRAFSELLKTTFC